MARTRSLKPGFFTNDLLAEIEPLGRILFQGLWCHADRAGRLLDRSKKLKAEILPYDVCDTDQLLNALHSKGFISRYEVDGERYIQIEKFTKHQRPHAKEPTSELPECIKQQPKFDPAPEIPVLAQEIPVQAGAVCSLTLNPIPLTLNRVLESGKSETAPPEGLHALNYARKLCVEIGLPIKGNMETVASSVEAVMAKHGLSGPAAYIHLLGKAKDAEKVGEKVDRWWFQDAKWREEVKRVSKREQEFAEARRRCEETN